MQLKCFLFSIPRPFPVFLTNICQRRLRSAQSDHSLRCLHEEEFGLKLPKRRRLIRMGGCPGWSESSLGAVVTLLAWSCCGSFTSFCLGSVGRLWSSIVALHWELFNVFFHTWFLNAVLVISRAFSAYFLRRRRPWLLRLPIPSDQINSFRRRWKDNDQEPMKLDSPPTHKMSAFEIS